MEENTESPSNMIELTVRTLDSQNHPFTVEDDITVEQFKVRIAGTVNIPADTQRIIYCGRVLQDSSKLSDYDVNGKVVHLVQRAPPSATPRSSSRSASPQPPRRTFRAFRGLDQGNTMYLGSMAFPSNLMESQGIIPPPPTHSLSGSRLNVARRMLRRAEAVLNLLENPSARPEDQNPADENQDEEVTPVIEARVIVPNNNEPIDDVINAVQNSLIDATNGTMRSGRVMEARRGSSNRLNSEERSPDVSAPDPPRRSASADNLTTESVTELPENASRTSEMSELLTQLAQLQVRFAPFLERYQSFMQEDPEISSENQRTVQLMLNRVSEVLHFLGHAYHSLSDIMITVRAQPPRPLLCRPILIQHSAVVQTGIPIQVEAQINVSADRPPPSASSAASQTSDSTAPQQPTTGGATATPAAPTQATAPSGGHTFVGLPFLPPGAAMRVQSFPVEIRAVHSGGPPPAAAGATGQNNNNNNAGGGTGASGGARTQAQGGGTATASGGGSSFNLGNPNVEFIMEVTPEGITIDSLETTVVGSNQANDLIRESLNGPPTEFLQSLMQMASHIMARNAQAPSTATASTAASTEGQATAQQPGQNTQARGTSQTQPTTATHTRSTARPHVHLAQQAVQAGFDPFLPCNSHHISRARRRPPTQQPQQAQERQATETPQQATSASTNTSASAQDAAAAPPTGQRPSAANFQAHSLTSLMTGIFDSIRQQPTESSAPPTASANIGDGPPNEAAAQGIPLLASLFQGLGGEQGNVRGQGLNPLDQLLQTFQLDQHITGDTLITELPIVFLRNLTLVDLLTLCSGNIEPLRRNIPEVQNFVRTRWCNGDTTPEGIQNATERLIAELRPLLEHFNTLPVRDDIDLVRSYEEILRHRLPLLITIILSLNVGTTLQLLHQEFLTAVKTLLAFALYACTEGQQGVEQIFEQIVSNIIPRYPQEFQNLTLMTSRIQLRRLFANLNIPESIVRHYIVRRSDPVRTVAAPTERVSSRGAPQVAEAMDLDEPEATGSTYSSPTSEIIEDPEPLPNVIIGSEPWHAQVPEDWVPIITRDAQKQRRQNPQGPFSDGYLSGMPSKRRKIVNSSKPHGSLPQVITESVRQAVSSTGLTSAAPLETVAQLAGASPEIQAAYRNLLRSTVQANLRDNEDFLPERFPNAAAYFDVDH
ncbi:unnamed protein product [Acanthoscelides obtectus]|uniref:BCL2-associated athanogene 6 n=1 Tax=Acanthoscelides obtectus TaxID=200917 RepID=A0A9P0JYK8_ACAOB|nr:unnamed protein product [Acanthoscelides obtectus]CAK1638071.1 Large proline-rich protein BAG6 [Acanthoscelides obtectus]